MKVNILIWGLLIGASTTKLHAQTADKKAEPNKENSFSSSHTILEQELPPESFKDKSVEMLIVDQLTQTTSQMLGSPML